jgi:serine/threonine-protein kinase
VSPEQALGSEADGRSDVYSLGVTCFFALTGRLPFEAENVQGVLAKHVQEIPPSITLLRPDVPRKLAWAIDRCLAKNPKHRFGTGEELADAAAQARARLREVPAALEGVRRQAEFLVIDAFGFGALSAMVSLEALAPPSNLYFSGYFEMTDWGIRIAVWLLTLGVIASRSIGLMMGCRAALGQGFTVAHLCSAIPGSDIGFHGPEGVSRADDLPPILAASALVGGFVILGVAWVFFWEWATLGSETPLSLAMRLPVAISLVVLPVLVGRAFGGGAVGRWPGTQRLWARFWRGRIGTWIVKASGFGLGKARQPKPVEQPTEALVAGAVAALFEALPPEYRSRLEEVPELISRLEAVAEELRAREAELDRALATVGPVQSTAVGRGLSGPGSVDLQGLASVKAHRAKAAEDLVAARTLVGTRLSAAVAALENLRLGLLRLQAGVGSPDELTADLRAAREVGRRVRGLLDGEREVETSLNLSRHGQNSGGSGGESPMPEPPE